MVMQGVRISSLRAVKKLFHMLLLKPFVPSSYEKRNYLLAYRSFSDTLPFQREYTLLCKVQCRVVRSLTVGILAACTPAGKLVPPNTPRFATK